MKNNQLGLCNGKGIISLPFFLFAGVLFLFSSCTTTKHSEYFKTLQGKDTTIQGTIPNNYESRIVAGDRLAITVSSLNPTEDILFNSTANIQSGISPEGGSAGNLVLPDGTVFLHRLGSVPAAGLTRRLFAKKLEEKLTPYLKDPIVQVSYVNHKVTIIGEVGKPSIISMPEEQIPLLDALVSSGDLNSTARRTDITIIRDEGDHKTVKHVNLEDNSIFTSPYYYVKPNDIILVNADLEKTVKDEKRAKLQTSLSLTATVVSLVLVILSRFIK